VLPHSIVVTPDYPNVVIPDCPNLVIPDYPNAVIPDLIRDLQLAVGCSVSNQRGADAGPEIPALRCAPAGMTEEVAFCKVTRFLAVAQAQAFTGHSDEESFWHCHPGLDPGSATRHWPLRLQPASCRLFVIPDLIRDPQLAIGRSVSNQHGADGGPEIPALRCAPAGMTEEVAFCKVTRFLAVAQAQAFTGHSDEALFWHCHPGLDPGSATRHWPLRLQPASCRLFVIPDLIRDPQLAIGRSVGNQYGVVAGSGIQALRCAPAGMTEKVCACGARPKNPRRFRRRFACTASFFCQTMQKI